MEYKKIYNSYNEYINKCRALIKEAFFTEEDAYKLPIYNHSTDINQIVTNHRLKMIDIKLDHTMRMIEQIIKVNNQLDLKVDFQEVLKVAILFHDIGRFNQATWSNTFSDTIYTEKGKPFNDHGEAGKYIFDTNDFNVSKEYIPIIGEVILHHLNFSKESRLTYKWPDEVSKIDLNQIVTGNFTLNESEWQIASLIVQLVADIDKMDILYQFLLPGSDFVRDYIYDKSGDKLEDIATKWGISKEEIESYNRFNDGSSKCVKIPIQNLSINKLEVPAYFKEMFYNNTWLYLKTLQQDINWNFISTIYWRLSNFLNNINFYCVLANIEESNLLDKIYEQIPDKIKPVLFEAFEFAKERLINEKLINHKRGLYLK